MSGTQSAVGLVFNQKLTSVQYLLFQVNTTELATKENKNLLQQCHLCFSVFCFFYVAGHLWTQ